MLSADPRLQAVYSLHQQPQIVVENFNSLLMQHISSEEGLTPDHLRPFLGSEILFQSITKLPLTMRLTGNDVEPQMKLSVEEVVLKLTFHLKNEECDLNASIYMCLEKIFHQLTPFIFRELKKTLLRRIADENELIQFQNIIFSIAKEQNTLAEKLILLKDKLENFHYTELKLQKLYNIIYKLNRNLAKALTFFTNNHNQLILEINTIPLISTSLLENSKHLASLDQLCLALLLNPRISCINENRLEILKNIFDSLPGEKSNLIRTTLLNYLDNFNLISIFHLQIFGIELNTRRISIIKDILLYSVNLISTTNESNDIIPITPLRKKSRKSKKEKVAESDTTECPLQKLYEMIITHHPSETIKHFEHNQDIIVEKMKSLPLLSTSAYQITNIQRKLVAIDQLCLLLIILPNRRGGIKIRIPILSILINSLDELNKNDLKLRLSEYLNNKTFIETYCKAMITTKPNSNRQAELKETLSRFLPDLELDQPASTQEVYQFDFSLTPPEHIQQFAESSSEPNSQTLYNLLFKVRYDEALIYFEKYQTQILREMKSLNQSPTSDDLLKQDKEHLAYIDQFYFFVLFIPRHTQQISRLKDTFLKTIFKDLDRDKQITLIEKLLQYLDNESFVKEFSRKFHAKFIRTHRIDTIKKLVIKLSAPDDERIFAQITKEASANMPATEVAFNSTTSSFSQNHSLLSKSKFLTFINSNLIKNKIVNVTNLENSSKRQNILTHIKSLRKHSLLMSFTEDGISIEKILLHLTLSLVNKDAAHLTDKMPQSENQIIRFNLLIQALMKEIVTLLDETELLLLQLSLQGKGYEVIENYLQTIAVPNVSREVLEDQMLYLDTLISERMNSLETASAPQIQTQANSTLTSTAQVYSTLAAHDSSIGDAIEEALQTAPMPSTAPMQIAAYRPHHFQPMPLGASNEANIHYGYGIDDFPRM